MDSARTLAVETVAEDTVPSAMAAGLESSEAELSALVELVATVPATTVAVLALGA